MVAGTRRVGGVACRDIDGVPVLTSAQSGPLRGALLFRVGQADETLPTRGITHLVEHLALTRTSRGPHAFNGATGDVFTAFVVAGEPQDVVHHLGQVCEALADLPFDRLEHERGVIRTEAARRSGAFASALSTWRWGAQGYGLLGYEELGLPALDEQQLASWARTNFTRANAALWLSGPVPRGLRLPLPETTDGLTQSTPPLDALIDLPAAFTLSDRGVAFSYLAPRAAEGAALLYVLTKRLQARLRDELGVSYHIESALQRLTPDTSLHVYFADCLPENAAAAQQGVIDVLDTVLKQPATAEELAELLTVADLAEQHESAGDLGHLDYVARQLLLGGDIKTRRTIQREQRAVTLESLHPYARQALSTLLAAVPNAGTFPRHLGAIAPAWSHSTAAGKQYPPAPGRSDPRITDLVVGAVGISALVGVNAVTVNYRDCAAMIRFDDGARTLIGNDGFTVRFAPEDWLGSNDVPQLLDLRVPQDRWVVGGERPQPRTSSAATPGASPRAGVRRLARWRAPAIAAALFAAIGIATSLAGSPSNTSADVNSPSTGLIMTVHAGDCLYTTAEINLGVILPAPCTGQHDAEVISVRTEPSTPTSGGLDAICSADATRDLTAKAAHTIQVNSVATTDGRLICYARSQSGDPLDAPLPRR